MKYVGQSSTDPSTGTVTIGSIVITPENGNVCRYQNKEFIYDSGAWYEFGDTSGLIREGNVTSADISGTIPQAKITNLVQTVSDIGTRITNEVADLNADIGLVDIKASNNASDIISVQADVSFLENHVDQAETDISNLQSDYDSLKTVARTGSYSDLLDKPGPIFDLTNHILSFSNFA